MNIADSVTDPRKYKIFTSRWAGISSRIAVIIIPPATNIVENFTAPAMSSAVTDANQPMSNDAANNHLNTFGYLTG